MIGACVHSRSRAADLDAVDVGQHEVDDRGVRRLQRGGVERLPRRRRRHDVEARVAQHDPQRPQDLRLVVADEDARGVAHGGPRRGAAARSRSSGISTTNVVPWPGSDSTQTRPPLTSTKPRTMARPRPEPRCPVGRCPSGRTARRSARSCAGGMPGPAIDDPDEHAAARRRGPGRRPGGRPSSGWRSRAGSRTRARAGRRRRAPAEVVVERQAERARRAGRGRRRRPGSPPPASTTSRRGSAAPRLEPREVEQVVDEAREPRRLRADVGDELVALGVARGSASAAPPRR